MTIAEGVSGYFQRKPRTFDVIVAVIWTLLSFASSDLYEDEGQLVWLVPAFLASGVVLYWRRRWPIHVFAFQGAIVLGLTILDIDSPVPLALLCGTYSLAAYTPERRESIIAISALVAAGFATVLLSDPQYLSDVIFTALTLFVGWAIGDSLRTRRQYQQSVLDRAERAEALRDSLAQRAVAEERTRIARDLHDVVAHSMSLMVVQAGAARRVVSADPEAAAAALEAIESVGRNSLDEMRRILGVLRGDDDAGVTSPQPDIAALDPLVEEFRAAGLPVELDHQGDRRPLPVTLELTAFRIVQESLTNTLKHAGPASAHVTLDYEDAALNIVVEDDGAATPSPGSGGNGYGGQKGHVGMRERVGAFGGTFTAMPKLSGGYRVAVSLPITGVEAG